MSERDLVGAFVVLVLPNAERIRRTTFYSGQRGVVLRRHRLDHGWVVAFTDAPDALFFTDELEETEPVISSCPCAQGKHDECRGCPCQHREVQPVDEPTADPKDC